MTSYGWRVQECQMSRISRNWTGLVLSVVLCCVTWRQTRYLWKRAVKVVKLVFILNFIGCWLSGNTRSFLGWLLQYFTQILLKYSAIPTDRCLGTSRNAPKQEGDHLKLARKNKRNAFQFVPLKNNHDQNLSFRWRSSLRLSLKDILNAIDTGAEFTWRKKLWFEIGKTEVEETLNNCSSNCLLPLFKSCGKEGFQTQILEVLDHGTCSFVCTVSSAWFFDGKKTKA